MHRSFLSALIGLGAIVSSANALPVKPSAFASLSDQSCNSVGNVCRISRPNQSKSLTQFSTASGANIGGQSNAFTQEIVLTPMPVSLASSATSLIPTTTPRSAGSTPAPLVRLSSPIRATTLEEEEFFDTPLPAAAPLLLMGLAGLGLTGRRRRNA